jgi:outer membrane protein assembly factor BamB
MKTINIPRSGFGLFLALATCSFAVNFVALGADDNWPHWRGPNANGSTDSGEYPVKWDPANVHWKVKLPGKGSSSPIVWDERIYLTSPSAGQDAVLAYDFDGELLWETKLGAESPPKHRTLGSSSNASPITDGDGIFAYFKSGSFAALEFDGSVRWRMNLVERFGRDQLFWDQGTSPVLTEQHVVMTRMHGGDSWIAGFDKKTGEMQWQQERNYKTPNENDNGYTTPVLFDHNGKKALLVWGADHLTAHDASDGSLLWSVGEFNPEGTAFWPAIASPVIHDNIAVVPVGRDDRNQASVHGIRLGGSGNVTATHRAWQRDDIGVFVSSPAEYQGRVYLLRHRGEVVCLDPATGKTIWNDAFPRSSSSYYSSPVLANGVLYAAREDGVVFVARVQDGFELVSEIPMGERIIASPVPVADRLLIRGDDHLFCVKSSDQ